MLPIYLLTGTYFLKEKSNAINLCLIFTSNSRTEAMLTVSDRWREFCVYLVGKNHMKESQETEKSSVLNLHR